MTGYRSIEDALSQGSGIERSFICPSHDDHSASASINSITGLWICYACGARGRVDLERMEIDADAIARTLRKILTTVTTTRRTFPESWLELFDANGPGEYWRSRFTAEACRYFRLGMDLDRSHATYPLRDNHGRVLGLVRRALDDQDVKYRYPSSVSVRDYLFNYDRCTSDVVVLTEGATDAIAAHEAGFDAMALYGSSLSVKQRNALNRYAPALVVLAFDMDVAGEAATRQVQRMLSEFITVRAIWDTYKDLAEMPVEVRQDVLGEAVAHAPGRGVASQTCESNARTIHRRISIKPSKR